MLTEICQYLHNYFDYERHVGEITIVAGEDGLYPSNGLHPSENLHPQSSVSAKVFCNGVEIEIGDGQYFALFRQRIPLGVFQLSELTENKTFAGSVWLMDVPKAIKSADEWAETWKTKNMAAGSEANSVYQSESFGGYSYSKGNNSKGKVGASIFDNAQFAAMLAPYRKLP